MNLEELGIPFTDLGERKEIELLWHISQSLVSKRSLDEVLQLIVTMTAGAMRSNICSLMLLDESTGELRIAVTQALSAAYINKGPVKAGESISGRALSDRKPVVVDDVSKEKSYGFPAVAKAEGLVSMISVPMISDGRAIGVINSYTTEPHVFTETEIKILETVAGQAAAAIEKARLREENRALKQALDEGAVIGQAKEVLMERDGLKPAQASQRLDELSRTHHQSRAEVARSVLMVYGMKSVISSRKTRTPPN